MSNISNMDNKNNINNIDDMRNDNMNIENMNNIDGVNSNPPTNRELSQEIVPYKREKKFKSSKDIINYIVKFYYKKYKIHDDLPNYLIREIILYKISNFKFLAKDIDRKDYFGPRGKEGTMLWFNGLIIDEKKLRDNLIKLLNQINIEMSKEQENKEEDKESKDNKQLNKSKNQSNENEKQSNETIEKRNQLNENRKLVEKNLREVEKMLKIAEEGYKESKKMYHLARRSEENRLN